MQIAVSATVAMHKMILVLLVIVNDLKGYQ
jgi:hypothetical protein